MINFINNNAAEPFLKLREKYSYAVKQNQRSVEAVSISSFNKLRGEVNCRYVNLKTIDNNKFIFFTNYNSEKSIEFKSHDQIAATLYWQSINTQIRIRAKIKKTSIEFNQIYFQNRSSKKNALAISSKQSSPIDSYESIKNNYKKSLELDNLKECPDYWGGYSFEPYYLPKL